MKEPLHPYVIFLPSSRKQNVLRAIFRSKVPTDILSFSVKQGISEKIYQKDLINTLDYSNKTLIEQLKKLTELEILEEHMEKSLSAGRTVWVKYFSLSELGRWFALLLIEEENVSREEKIRIVRDTFGLYIRWIMKLSEKLGMKRHDLLEIFRAEMKDSLSELDGLENGQE